MTKAELVQLIARKHEVTQKSAGEILDTLSDSITVSLKKGDKFALPGLGTWSVKNRAARTGRNPQTGQPLKIAAKSVPHFSASSVLKEAVNKKKK